MAVRVRFAPSPTGYLHIGGARTALFNFLFARHYQGKLLLRIEDTDQKRNDELSTRTILEGLRWLGIVHDEGPYFSSQRLDLYRACARRLEESGRAYWREDPGKGRALVFRIERTRVEWDDLVHGPSVRDLTVEPDLVILKSDGFPTYNFAVVVDDHDMGITHVLRADEHYPNTPKQIQLYRALGWEPPRFGHVPLIFDPQGRKISKREKYDFPVTVEEARLAGYLPEAVVNFLALLGWSPGENRELLTLEEMIRLFDERRIENHPARFLTAKLKSFNKHYLKLKSPEEIVALCRPYLSGEVARSIQKEMADLKLWLEHPPQDASERQAEARRERLALLARCLPGIEGYDLSGVPEAKVRRAVLQQQERLERLPDIVPLTRFVFAPRKELGFSEKDDAVRKHLVQNVRAEAALAAAERTLSDLRRRWGDDPPEGEIESALKASAAEGGFKPGEMFQPLRVALTGSDRSPPIHQTVGILGMDESLRRVGEARAFCKRAVEAL